LLAYQNDLIKYSRLSASVGDEVLVGSRILRGKQEALREEQRCLNSASVYVDIPYTNTWTDKKGVVHSETEYYTYWGTVWQGWHRVM